MSYRRRFYPFTHSMSSAKDYLLQANRNFMSAVKMLCSSLPSGRGIVFARDALVLAWAAYVVRSGRGGESLGRPLSTEGQIPGVMPIIIPSIFRGTWRMLLRVQKETILTPNESSLSQEPEDGVLPGFPRLAKRGRESFQPPLKLQARLQKTPDPFS